MMVRSGAVDIIVVDSVAALVPKAEIDRRIMGRFSCGSSGKIDVPGAQKADSDHQ